MTGDLKTVPGTLELCSGAVCQGVGQGKRISSAYGLSRNWKNIYDEERDFIRPKTASGEFLGDFDPFAPWIGFQEGNAGQYTFYVPHAPEESIDKMGEEEFVNRLDSIFTVSEKTKFGGKEIDAFAESNTCTITGINRTCILLICLTILIIHG